MKKYFTNLGKSLREGFYSIAEGMSTFSIFPNTEIEIPSDIESWENDGKAIRSDWENVGKYITKATKEFSSKNNLDSKV